MKSSGAGSQGTTVNDGCNNHSILQLARSVAAVFLICFLAGAPTSVPAQTRKRPSERSIRMAAETKQLPTGSKRYALIIGIDKYDDKEIKQLGGAINDAKGLEDALIKYAEFDKDHIVRLTSDQPASLQPTRQNILALLTRLKNTVPNDGLLLFAFSGHGISIGDKAFLLPSNARMENDVDYLELEAIPVPAVKKLINSSGVRQRILLLDACRDNPTGRGAGGSTLTEAYTRALAFDRRNDHVDAFVTIYATQFGQKAYENRRSNMGYFTEALVEGLKGEAANTTTGEITLSALMQYIKRVVPTRTQLNEGQKQDPWWGTEGYAEDLVIARVAPTAKVEVPVAIPTVVLGRLFVQTNPGAAQIEIKSEDGKALRGTSSKEGQYKADLVAGKYQITVSSEKHVTITKEVIVTKGEPELHTISLSPTTGSILLVGVLPPDVRILINGGPTANVSRSDNQIEVRDVPVGTSTVQISHPAFATWQKKVPVKGGEATSLYAILERRMTRLTIKSEPSALVYIDDIPRVRLGSNGETSLDVEPSSHKITVEKDGYDTREESKTLVAGGEDLVMKLTRKPIVRETLPVAPPSAAPQPRQTALVVGTSSGRIPVIAKVIVQSQDGSFKREGLSAKGKYQLGLDPGLYDITVTAENYLPFTERVSIVAGQPADVVAADLAPTSGSIMLLGAFQADMEILLDGKPINGAIRSDSRIELKAVSAGSHKVQVKHKAIEPWEKEVEVLGGVPTPISIAFERRLTQLTVKSEPRSVIFVDNIAMARVFESGEVMISRIEPGLHKIRAEKEGYEPSEVSASLNAGPTEVILKLTSAAYGAEFSDDFKEGLQSWSAPVAWQASREKGNLGIVVNGPGLGLIKDRVNDRPSVYKDFTMEFDISFKNAKGAAWVVRGQDPRNYYLFQLMGPKGSVPNRFRTYFYQNGKATQLKAAEIVPEDLSRSNDQFHITVEVRGNEIRHKIVAVKAPKPGAPQPFSVTQNVVFSQGAIGFASIEGEEFLVRWVGITPEK